MITQENIDKFFSAKRFAFAGVSTNPKKFGNYIFKELLKKEFELVPIHGSLEETEGKKCFKDLASIEEKPEALIICTKPKSAFALVKEAADAGIKNIWLQQGSQSDDSIQYCKDNNINLIHGQCMLMFADPVGSFHSFHRFVTKLIGKYPK